MTCDRSVEVVAGVITARTISRTSTMTARHAQLALHTRILSSPHQSAAVYSLCEHFTRHTSWLNITLSFMNCSQFPCLKLSLRNEHYILTEWISCSSLQIYRVICGSCRCNNITETHVDNILVSKFIKLKDCYEDEQHQMNENRCVNHKQIQIQLGFG